MDYVHPKLEGGTESFNGSFWDECLNTTLVLDIRRRQGHNRDVSTEYNESPPHRSLNRLSPEQYAV